MGHRFALERLAPERETGARGRARRGKRGSSSSANLGVAAASPATVIPTRPGALGRANETEKKGRLRPARTFQVAVISPRGLPAASQAPPRSGSVPSVMAVVGASDGLGDGEYSDYISTATAR